MKRSSLLLPEYPLQVLPNLANKIGLNEAIILQQIHYWLEQSKHEHKGKKWIYNSYKEWGNQFPFWSNATIRRTIANLEKKNLIYVDNFNKYNFDKTKWYSINYDELEVLEGVSNAVAQNEQTSESKRAKAVAQNEQTNTRDYTETTTDRESNHENKIDCIQKYQQDIGMINPDQIQLMTDWITDLDMNNQGEEIISEAINQSVKEKAKSFNYLNNKLKRYVDANVKTLDDAKAQSKTNGKPKKKKEVNDWLNQMIGE